ncbi:helix-turn-helix domain-containing protein [Aquirufa sp. Wall-65K1]
MSDFVFFSITLGISVLGFTVCFILFFGQSVPSLSSKLLAGLILSLVLTSLGNVIPYTKLNLEYPNTFKIYSWAPFCIGPFAYLYVKSVLHQYIRLPRKVLLLFIPAVLYVLNRIPFYLLTFEEKKQFVLSTLLDESLYILEPEGLLPIKWAPVIRFFFLIIFSIMTLIELINSRDKIFNPSILDERNKKIYNFHWVIITILFFGVIAAIWGGLIQLKHDNHASRVTLICIWVEILVISIYLFIQPKILYGLAGWVQIKNPIRSIQDLGEIEEEDEEIPHVSIHKGRDIWLTISKHFQNNHPYTKKGYTINELSEEINIPMYLISAVINQESGKNFSEFINDARINYLKILKENNPNFSNYSIEYIGNSIGFASRTSFVAAVKKRTGMVPKDYLAQL